MSERPEEQQCIICGRALMVTLINDSFPPRRIPGCPLHGSAGVDRGQTPLILPSEKGR
ncbi:MAG: hypothetical protein ACXVZP_01860 [Gaiellaceae bacterium]